MHESGPQFVPVIMTRDVQPMKGSTPYSVTGNWLVLIACAVILGVFWLRNRAAL